MPTTPDGQLVYPGRSSTALDDADADADLSWRRGPFSRSLYDNLKGRRPTSVTVGQPEEPQKRPLSALQTLELARDPSPPPPTALVHDPVPPHPPRSSNDKDEQLVYPPTVLSASIATEPPPSLPAVVVIPAEEEGRLGYPSRSDSNRLTVFGHRPQWTVRRITSKASCIPKNKGLQEAYERAMRELGLDPLLGMTPAPDPLPPPALEFPKTPLRPARARLPRESTSFGRERPALSSVPTLGLRQPSAPSQAPLDHAALAPGTSDPQTASAPTTPSHPAGSPHRPSPSRPAPPSSSARRPPAGFRRVPAPAPKALAARVPFVQAARQPGDSTEDLAYPTVGDALYRLHRPLWTVQRLTTRQGLASFNHNCAMWLRQQAQDATVEPGRLKAPGRRTGVRPPPPPKGSRLLPRLSPPPALHSPSSAPSPSTRAVPPPLDFRLVVPLARAPPASSSVNLAYPPASDPPTRFPPAWLIQRLTSATTRRQAVRLTRDVLRAGVEAGRMPADVFDRFELGRYGKKRSLAEPTPAPSTVKPTVSPPPPPLTAAAAVVPADVRAVQHLLSAHGFKVLKPLSPNSTLPASRGTRTAPPPPPGARTAVPPHARSKNLADRTHVRRAPATFGSRADAAAPTSVGDDGVARVSSPLTSTKGSTPPTDIVRAPAGVSSASSPPPVTAAAAAAKAKAKATEIEAAAARQRKADDAARAQLSTAASAVPPSRPTPTPTPTAATTPVAQPRPAPTPLSTALAQPRPSAPVLRPLPSLLRLSSAPSPTARPPTPTPPSPPRQPPRQPQPPKTFAGAPGLLGNSLAGRLAAANDGRAGASWGGRPAR